MREKCWLMYKKKKKIVHIFVPNYKTFLPVKTARTSTTRTFMTDTADEEKKDPNLAFCVVFFFFSYRQTNKHPVTWVSPVEELVDQSVSC